MVGVGENGAHDFITFATMFLTGFLMQIRLVWIIVLLWRLIQWRNAIFMTWEYFWGEAVPSASGGGQQRYEDAFRETKRYMNELKERVWWLLR